MPRQQRGSRPSRTLIVVLLGVGLLAPALSPASAAPGETDQLPSPARGDDVPEFVPGELLVRFEPGTPSSTRRSFRVANALERVEGLPVPGLEKVEVSGVGSAALLALAERLARHTAVRYAEPNYIVHALDGPDDPEFPLLWGLDNTGQVVGGVPGTPDADIDAPEGWGLAADSSGIVVGVIDTGVDINHPDLQDQIWENTLEKNGVPGVDDDENEFIDDVNGWDFANDDATVFDPLDGDLHGTHVAGTIAATMDNTTDVAGVSQAQIMPVKFLGKGGSGSTANAIKAIDYATDNNADLTNNSWGGGGFNQALLEAIERANAKDILFVAAAGNNGTNNDSTKRYPSSHASDNIISVAATTNTDELASFSNYGATTVDLGAPGQSILSTVPSHGKAILTGPDIPGGEAYRSVFHTFGLEGVGEEGAPNEAQRQALLGVALTWMGVGTSDQILLVKDDRSSSSSFLPAYHDTLTSLGHTVDETGNVTTHTTGTGCSSGPAQATLDAARVVIWFTGSSSSCTLTSNDRTRIGNYLSGGANRNLLLFGQDIGFDLSDISSGMRFLRNILKTEYVDDADQNFRLSAVAGTPYAGVGQIDLVARRPSSDVPEGQGWSSAVSARNGAAAGLQGASTAWFNGTSMAAPHVAGVAAQVISRCATPGHLAIKEQLLAAGDPLEALDGKTVSGKRLNLEEALKRPPAAPPELIAQPAPAGRIDVSWDPTCPADGFRVYRDTSSGFTPSPATLISGPSLVDGTSFEDTNTVDGTTYFYVVRAQSFTGDESDASSEASATADDASPTVAFSDDPQPDFVLRGESHVLEGTADDDGLVAGVDVAIQRASGYWDGETFGSVDPVWIPGAILPEGGAAHVAWSFDWGPLPAVDWELFTVLVRARDGAGNLSGQVDEEIRVDNVKPSNVGADAGARYQKVSDFDVTWDAQDGSAPPEDLVFDLERRAAKFNGGWGAWSTWEAAGDATSADSEQGEADFEGRPGRTYCFRATATDAAGNEATGSKACTAVPLNDTQLEHRGSWTERTDSPSYYLDTFSRSTQKGARLVRDSIRAKHLALVATKCPNCGSVVIKWRGKVLKRVSLKAAEKRTTKIIKLAKFGGVRKGKLVVIVTSSGKPVIVEGLGASRV